MLFSNSAADALNELSQAPIVRFSLLALSSIFFLVDPFAAIPSFLAITESADAARRKRMARKGALTCFIVLTSFAVAGQLIFEEETFVTRILHNETAFMIQRRLQHSGLPMVVLPVRLNLKDGPRLAAPSLTEERVT